MPSQQARWEGFLFLPRLVAKRGFCGNASNIIFFS